MEDILGSHVDIDIQGIRGNRSCIKKLKIFKDGNLGSSTDVKLIKSDFKTRISPGKDGQFFCENTQMKVILTDSDDNQFGGTKTISLLRISNTIQGTVLKPFNDEIFRNCTGHFVLSIYCRSTLTEKTSLTLRRGLALRENLMDLDVGRKMYGKYCSLVDQDDDHHWTFIGEVGTRSVRKEANRSCQNLLILQILLCVLLLTMIMSMFVYVRKRLIRNTNASGGVEEEREDVDNVAPLRDSLPRNVLEQDRTSLRKRGSVNQSFNFGREETA